MCASNLTKVVPIAVRYSAVRRQFGIDGQELPVIEYQMQQWRLFPYLASAYVMKVFSETFFLNFIEFMLNGMAGGDKDELAMAGAEIHAISSSAKPLAGWLARDAIQECREACGGHGYLRSAGIGQLRNDHDANNTYEGDNNVLLQQASNWLVSIWSNPKREEIRGPLGSLSFLKDVKTIMSQTFTAATVQDLMNPAVIMDAYKWLVCWLLQTTAAKYHSLLQAGKDTFTAKNDSQVYHARTLSLAYIEHHALERFADFSNQPNHPPEIAAVLRKLLVLYGLWSLEKHSATLYQGGYCTGPAPCSLIREGILELCTTLKDDSVALVDAIAPPDFVLNSVLGMSNGEVYKNLQAAMSQCPNGLERPEWWKMIAQRLQAKL